MTTAEWLTVLTTTDDEEKARRLARGAVEARLAACAQIPAPVTSVYRWEGTVETADEWQVLFKTTADRYEALESWLTEAHDYDVPEIIATPVARGSAAYLEWVTRETRDSVGSGEAAETGRAGKTGESGA
ncbi:divalent-cation tolerance protein CutA [Streptomyces jeddahensis]|uniref:Divalent-cation tolerance protein CutA n=1 Tax=Streptomyces jeddahensis TaxID=1716141 RepID=A0A177HEY2_9ACTN|nr:divalent-cation tolerance protein CutA [Streptomyces jeddahensis]OAH09492.1 divalent-cation tolerance protein CutA [Streptomyces jeddahensis]